MSTKICPRCRKAYTTDKFAGPDYQHTCFGNEVLSQEDVVVIGNWEDFRGDENLLKSGLSPHLTPQIKGQLNKIQGSIGNLENGMHIGEFTIRGARNATHRQRQHIESIGSNIDSIEDLAGAIEEFTPNW